MFKTYLRPLKMASFLLYLAIKCHVVKKPASREDLSQESMETCGYLGYELLSVGKCEPSAIVTIVARWLPDPVTV